MSVPTDKEIKKAAAVILQGCDIATTTLKSVRKQLEEKFQCSLSERKEIIYKSFDKFISKNEDVIKYNEVVDAEIAQEAVIAEEEAEAEYDEPKKKAKSKGGFAAEVHLGADLAEFLGCDKLPRTEVTKRIWAYIKENELQDPSDKRKILCDEALEKVLRRKSVHMFTMTKVLSTMMKSAKEMSLGTILSDNEDEEDDEEPQESKSRKAMMLKTEKKVVEVVKAVKKEVTKADKNSDKKADKSSKKADKQDKNADKKADKKKRKAEDSDNEESGYGEDGNGESGKKAAKGNKKQKVSAFTISDGLCGLLGLQSNDTRYQVVQKMWEYIRGNSLQNPADKREVKLDKPLQEIFKVKTFTIFSMNKHIAGQMHKNE